MPYSSARRKSSSSSIASGSPCAAASDCSTSRRRCSTGIDEFGVGRRDLDAADDQVPGLGQARIVAVRTGQRADLDRVVADERRLDQGVLDQLLVQLQHDLAGGPARASSATSGRSAMPRRLCGAGVRRDRLADAPRTPASCTVTTRHWPARSISTPSAVTGAVMPAAVGGLEDERAGQFGHRVVVAVGLVRLEHGEFRRVRGVDALVAERPADLVDPLDAADDAPLEVELGGDAQRHLQVERVEMGVERPGGRAAVHRSAAPASRPRGSRARARSRAATGSPRRGCGPSRGPRAARSGRR